MTDAVIEAKIAAELTLAYKACGRAVPDSDIAAVANRLAYSVDFRDVREVEAAFSRAKNICDIPTQRILSECLNDIRAEHMPDTGAPAIEFKDPRAAWLPKEYIRKRINLNIAIKNLSAAISDREYQEFCRTHQTTRQGDTVVLVTPDAARAFDEPKKAHIRELYRRYWRKLPAAQGYTAGAPLNLGLVPPTVPQFRVMLDHDAKMQGFT